MPPLFFHAQNNSKNIFTSYFKYIIYTLPHLEVQCLDAVSIHECKETCKTNQNHRYWRLEVRVISEMVLNVIFNHRLRRRPRNCNGSLHISVLAYD